MSSLLTQLGQKTKVELDKKLALAGGTMTGALTLSADPSANLHAATKQYVDSVSSSVTSLQSEVDATQTGAGLGANGAYSANASTNYLGSVASLKAADEALDSQLKTVADAVLLTIPTSPAFSPAFLLTPLLSRLFSLMLAPTIPTSLPCKAMFLRMIRTSPLCKPM
jgi:hypothetical protein